MSNSIIKLLRSDCLESLKLAPELQSKLNNQRIAVIGGTGFIGTWLAEVISALNDDLGCRIQLDLIGRSTSKWLLSNTHLSNRSDIALYSSDIRSSFNLAKDVTYVINAAGIADPRMHSSDPIRMHETHLQGALNSLYSATQLERLQRFVHLSSGLVVGAMQENAGIKERDVGLLDFTRIHNAYAESRRATENLVALFANQHRLAISTARAFTFVGPYQPLETPWAINNFISDSINRRNIKILGDGSTKRSYIYGSDAACWLLKTLTDGKDNEIYNIGGSEVISHADVATLITNQPGNSSTIIYSNFNTDRSFDFYPDLEHVKNTLNLQQAISTLTAIDRTIKWHGNRPLEPKG